jgi:hypothetical protein|nr:MAG TPA: hypothetical protein [Caudoviricetes sp.]
MKQVLSIEQMKHLQELGLDTSDASIYWARVSHGSRIDDKSKGVWFLSLHKEFQTCGFMSYEILPTYTLQDILDKLPKEIKTSTDTYWLGISIYDCKEWYVCYSMSDEFDYYEEFKSRQLIDAAYEMLCWCIEKGYIKTN